MACFAATAASAWAQQPAATPDDFANLDVDGDGLITRLEFIHGRGLLFDEADRDRDGLVGRDDLAAAAGSRRTLLESRIAPADLNHDGFVSLDEMSLAGTPLFDDADRNGDGAVDRAEVAALLARPPSG